MNAISLSVLTPTPTEREIFARHRISCATRNVWRRVQRKKANLGGGELRRLHAHVSLLLCANNRHPPSPPQRARFGAVNLIVLHLQSDECVVMLQ